MGTRQVNVKVSIFDSRNTCQTYPQDFGSLWLAREFAKKESLYAVKVVITAGKYPQEYFEEYRKGTKMSWSYPNGLNSLWPNAHESNPA